MKYLTNSSKLLDVHQAAQYLGVHAGTIRRWAYSNQLKGVKVGVRGDWRFQTEELDKMSALHNKVELQYPKELALAPHSDWSRMSDTAHFVQYYEDDAFLLDSVREFLSKGDSAIVVATREHLNHLEKGLKIYGLELEEARRIGQYVSLDATEALSHFIVNDMPDREKFFEFIGSIVSRATSQNKTRIFGEMVALLWADGKKEAAIYLEELWNELQKQHPFSLVCAYPLSHFNDHSHAEHFSIISSLHSSVFPSESYSELSSIDKRLLEITLLQQKAQSLEIEISKREKTEQQRLDFLSATSHELKTPLTSQKAYIQLLKQWVEKNGDDGYIKYIDKIDEQTAKLQRLVEELLEGTKINAGKLNCSFTIFDLNTCAEKVIGDLQPISQHKIELRGKLSRKIIGDEERISQVITNLIENGIKYSPHSKKIDISITEHKDSVTVSVTDYGIGIPQEDVPHIFEEFYRVEGRREKTYPGLGVGLYISSEIVKGHKGIMSVTSTIGEGSTFSFTIPFQVV